MEENEFIAEEFLAEEEERPNRTFIILVAALGGILALGICAFVVWALIGNRWVQDRIQTQNQTIQTTNTAVAVAVAETATADAQPTATLTPVPTDIPTLTPTRTPTPKPPPATSSPTPATAEPTATRGPTATLTTGSASPPDTGIGALGASVLAVGLLFLLVVVRRLRRTA